MATQHSLEKKRQELLGKMVTLKEALPGNLVSAQARSKPKGRYASAPYGPVWRLTWKEQKKTKTFYVRQGELPQVRQGVTQMRQFKKLIGQIGELNMRILIAHREDR